MFLAIPPEVWWWLGVVVAFAGIVVSALHVRHTAWALLLVGAFAIEMLVAVFYRITTGPAHREILGLDIYSAQRVVSFLAVCGRTAMVIGIGGVLSIAGRRVATTKSRARL